MPLPAAGGAALAPMPARPCTFCTGNLRPGPAASLNIATLAAQGLNGRARDAGGAPWPSSASLLCLALENGRGNLLESMKAADACFQMPSQLHTPPPPPLTARRSTLGPASPCPACDSLSTTRAREQSCATPLSAPPSWGRSGCCLQRRARASRWGIVALLCAGQPGLTIAGCTSASNMTSMLASHQCLCMALEPAHPCPDALHVSP